MTLVMLFHMFLQAPKTGAPALRLDEIRLRDPYVLPVPTEGKYYLYGTNGTLPKATGFDAFVSADLEHWSGPVLVFRPPNGFWATQDFWAPEVHPYKGRYYMFASFKSKEIHRGTQILVADKPEGPFTPHSDGPVTPQDWECLDGTLYVDPDARPWIVFCHEWTQIGDGTICALRLTMDLKKAEGKPITLFKASDAPWVKSSSMNRKTYVTDGPFLYQTHAGPLLLLWSSFGEHGYGLTVARSESDAIKGPWRQAATPVYGDDGGHGVLFRTFDGKLMLSLHHPNNAPHERPCLFVVTESKDGKSLSLVPYKGKD